MSQSINLWEFTFVDSEGEEMEVCYYTFSDNSELAKCQFNMDEPGISWDVFTSAGTITKEQMIDWYGNLEMVLDKEENNEDS